MKAVEKKKIFSILTVILLIFITNFSLIAEGKVNWDRSSLKFDPEYQCQGSCYEVSAKIINGGSDMEGGSNWELYYSERGNPKNGQIVASGIIPPLKSNESYIITVNLQELDLESPIGVYKFKAYQRPGHPGIGVLWSNDCVVLCQEQEFPLISLNKGVSQNYSKPEETITFSFEIKNIGNVDLTDILLTDELFGETWQKELPLLKSGESHVFTIEYKIPKDLNFPITNKANVKAYYKETMVEDWDETIIFRKLILTSICSNDPTETRRWRVTNLNPFDIEFTWDIYGSTQKGTLIIKANDILIFETSTLPGPNTARIFVNGILHDVKASSGAKCTIPSISITKVPDREEVIAGETIVYTITIANTTEYNEGSEPLREIVVIDTFKGKEIQYYIEKLEKDEIYQFQIEYLTSLEDVGQLVNTVKVQALYKGTVIEGEATTTVTVLIPTDPQEPTEPSEPEEPTEPNEPELPKTGQIQYIYFLLLGVLFLLAGFKISILKR